MSEPQHIVAVTTPTGHVGRSLVRHLIRAGVRPRVLVRDSSRLDADVRDQVDVREVGDLADPAAVTAATAGVDALHLVVPSLAVDDPVAAYAEFGTAAAQAIVANRIGRTVLQSSVGAELRHGAGEIDGLARVEQILDAALGPAGLAVTHLRCGFFMENLLLDPGALERGVFTVVLPVDQPMAWVAADDIASVAAGLLLNRDWSGRRVQAVHGPADLSWAEAADIVSTATGHAVRAERIADEAMRAQLLEAGMPAGQTEAILGMSTGLRDGFTPEQPRDVVTTTSTTLRSWAVSALPPSAG